MGIDSLLERIAKKLTDSGKKLATAESCTGGLIGHLLTNIPGSSEYYLGGIIVYSNALKTSLLEVPNDILDTYGAVSRKTVERMCDGLQKLTGADYGISVSGIAGPGGGTPTKPVGLIYIGILSGNSAFVTKYKISGKREEIKRQAAHTALYELEKKIS